jgi:hypothetical protein
VRIRFRVSLLAILSLSIAACDREGLVEVLPGDSPGQAAPTLETVIDPTDVPAWIDTAFFGFAGPGNATFLAVEEGTPDLVSRGLIRFTSLEDTVFLPPDTLSGALRFDSARVVFNVDTARTVLASTGTTVQLAAVKQGWDRGSADWVLAVDTPTTAIPWTDGPGGSFGSVLGETTMTEETDSLVIWLSDSDSLLRAWLDTSQVNKGLGVLVGDSGRVFLQLPRLHYNIVPEANPDVAVQFRALATDGTFIYDRTELALSPGEVRIGGVDAWRAFYQIDLPDSVTVTGSGERVILRGATINKAELFIVSLGAPPEPWDAEANYEADANDLVADFTVLGPKTPVGETIFPSAFEIVPDSLALGTRLPIDITARIQDWADVPRDVDPPPVRVALRARPEATTFGYWQFGAAGGDPEYYPLLRIAFTPATEFKFP